MSVILDKQAAFCKNLGIFIDHVSSTPGWQITEGEGERPPWVAKIYAQQGKGIADSLHIDRLAHDFNFYFNGALITDKAMLKPFGDFWKSLHADNAWGGDFTGTTAGDVFHFSMSFGGRK